MEKIKFRGRAKNSRVWDFGYYVKARDGASFIVRVGSDLIGHIAYLQEVAPEAVGQYTGLKDKNGVEIYEGDIVKIDGKYIRYIEYSQIFTAFVCMIYYDNQTKCFGSVLGRGYENYQHIIEVIGNIYDNPELLEEVE